MMRALSGSVSGHGHLLCKCECFWVLFIYSSVQFFFFASELCGGVWFGLGHVLVVLWPPGVLFRGLARLGWLSGLPGPLGCRAGPLRGVGSCLNSLGPGSRTLLMPWWPPHYGRGGSVQGLPLHFWVDAWLSLCVDIISLYLCLVSISFSLLSLFPCPPFRFGINIYKVFDKNKWISSTKASSGAL